MPDSPTSTKWAETFASLSGAKPSNACPHDLRLRADDPYCVADVPCEETGEHEVHRASGVPGFGPLPEAVEYEITWRVSAR